MDGYTVVVPGSGELSSTARALLNLADHPRDIRTIDNGTVFLVPDHVADAFVGKSAPAPVRRRRRKAAEDVNPFAQTEE